MQFILGANLENTHPFRWPPTAGKCVRGLSPHEQEQESIHHLHIDHNVPCLPPKILHNHCFKTELKSKRLLQRLIKQREKGWGIQYFHWPIPVFIRFIRKNHEYSEYILLWKIIKGSYMVWRGKVWLLRKITKKKIKITKSLLFVTFDGFGFKNEVRLTCFPKAIAFISKCFDCDK